MFEQEHKPEAEPGSPLHRLIHFLQHERRCWRRLWYWLRAFNQDVSPPPRCYAFRHAPKRLSGRKPHPSH